MTTMKKRDLDQILTEFLDAFNRMDLEAVMSFFSADAVYEPGDGHVHRGTEGIRQGFEPQFRRVWGTMAFHETDRAVDDRTRKVLLRWDCIVDMRSAKFYSVPIWLKLRAAHLRWGPRLAYKGIDVFHFSEAGQITGKFSYANFSLIKFTRPGVLQLKPRVSP